MNAEDAGIAEGGAVNRLNAQVTPPNASTGLLRVPATSSYWGSSQFYELLACLVYLVVSIGVMHGLGIQPNERPIPYQWLENTGDYVRNLTNNETYEHDTFPTLLATILSLVMPLAIQVGLSYTFGGQHDDVHATLCVYITALATRSLATEFVKLYVGYLRPIFYDFCQPDDDYQTCTADDGADIRKSFPSGHASMAFTGLTLLTLYIHGRFGVASRRYYRQILVGNDIDSAQPQWVRYTHQAGLAWARLISLLAMILPLGLALFIAASRVVDNKHFPADVVAGSVLGAAIAIYVHGLWFD